MSEESGNEGSVESTEEAVAKVKVEYEEKLRRKNSNLYMEVERLKDAMMEMEYRMQQMERGVAPKDVIVNDQKV